MIISLISLAFASCLKAPMPDIALKAQGQATYKKAFIKLYDASLCTGGPEFNMEEPFAIALDYRMKFSSEQIAGAGIHEMARFARKDKEDFAPLLPILEECFPDVGKGDQIIGVSEGVNTARFYYNEQPSCNVDYPNFRELFFGIWLGDETRAPNKARRLKGLSK